jgi:glycine dehydrogenase subunit 1
MAHPYIPLTDQDRAELLEAVGVSSINELFGEIPAEHLDPKFNLPPALSEPELLAHLKTIAAESTPGLPSFIGAGAYRHYIPSTVDAILSRGEYLCC